MSASAVRRAIVAVAAAFGALTGCATSTLTGQGHAHPTFAPTTSATAPTDFPSSSASTSPTTSPTAPPSSQPAPTSEPPTSGADNSGPCADATNATGVTQCLRRQLSQFWSGEINESIDEPVHLSPTAAQVPTACRPGLTAAPAFTCQTNMSLYINDSLLQTMQDNLAPDEYAYAFAAVQSHEFGHVLQYRLGQPQILHRTGGAAQSQFIEQQADCLSGVWAKNEGAADAGFLPRVFVRIASKLLTLISSNDEIRTHGTPAQRTAAIERGLATGRPQTCKLVTFS